MKRPRALGSSAIRGVLASFILIGCASANVAELRAATEKVSAMSVSEREALEHRINVIANDVANARPFLYEDRLPIHIEASFDPVSESLIMHTDERLGPSSGSPDVEDMRHAVDQTIWPLLESIPSFRGIDWRYGGKDIYFWYPQDRVHQNRQSRKTNTRSAASVLVSAGHGYYYHHGFSDWRPQRTPHNGVLEDAITTTLSSILSEILSYKNIIPIESRPPHQVIDEASGQPFYMLAAKYRIEKLLPERPDIWHSLPDDSTSLREYKEDIRSRPLYANSLGVDAAIHLHTNADDAPDVRGTRVLVQHGQLESSRLGSMILCYMREQIHSLESYRGFPLASVPNVGDYGENRLANMPSVIVEVGFHTNADDAAALKDPLFTRASMRGVAKGYRLFKEGRTCKELTAEVPEAVTGIAGDQLKIPVTTKGYPALPVYFEGKAASCESGSCGAAYGIALDESELEHGSMQYRCREDDVTRSPFSLRVVATDSDGAKSAPVEVAVTCTGSHASAVAS